MLSFHHFILSGAHDLHSSIKIKYPPLLALIAKNYTKQSARPASNHQMRRIERCPTIEDVQNLTPIQIFCACPVFDDLHLMIFGSEQRKEGGVVGVRDPFRIEKFSVRE